MIYTIGETVLDIIFRDIDNVKVKPGGSMLNTAVSLGRLGVNVAHVSVMATDAASGMLIEFLEDSGVKTVFINRNKNIKTSLALAYLNKNNDAEYTFYKDKFDLEFNIKFPEVIDSDVVHYGSFFSINTKVHGQLHSFLEKCEEKGVVKLYDPNFRKPHLPQLKQLMPLIEMNFKKADIVKGSNEDFDNIFGIKSGAEAWEKMKQYGVSILFYTKGENGSELFSNVGSFSMPTATIKTVSTIGAGDTYSSGIIYYIKTLNKKFNLDEIKLSQWKECVGLCHNFASQTCQSLDNYLSVQYCNTIKNV